MEHRMILFCTLLLVFSLSARPQQQRQLTQESQQPERRVALVIGNGDYLAAPLKNPVNDARDMRQALGALGFEVIYKENLNQNEMKRAIRAFGEKIRNGGIGLFYYSGHGVQVNGFNYLVPVDAEVESEEEVEYECVDAGFVLAQMESARNPINIVILDACRNNPFARSFRSASRGLAFMNAPSGTLIAYSTAPGSVAGDGDARNGVYTQELLRHLQTPGLSVEDLFKKVRASVRLATQGKQTPWESSSLIGSFYFNPTGNKRDTAPVDTITSNIERNKGALQPPDDLTAPGEMVGAWRARGTEFGHELEMTFTTNADGTYQYVARSAQGLTTTEFGAWRYSEGILHQSLSNGASAKSAVKWIDNNTFELTIIDNGTPGYGGMTRRYHRIK